MLRRSPGIEAELILQRTDRALPISQQLKNPHPHRMPQHPKQTRLHLMDRTRPMRHQPTISDYLQTYEDLGNAAMLIPDAKGRVLLHVHGGGSSSHDAAPSLDQHHRSRTARTKRRVI